MASAIDASKPTDTVGFMGDLRANLAAAKAEIEELQNTAASDRATLHSLPPDQNSSIDLSNAANMGTWRTGADWTAERTITLNNKAVANGRICFSNNGGHILWLASGTNSPVDFPPGFDPFRLHVGEYIELIVNPATGNLIKTMRAWETSSSRIFPMGGTTGQAVRKLSSGDSDFSWQDDPVPADSPTFTGTVTLPLVTGQRSVQANATGSMASAVSGRTVFLTGNVTAVPITAGWHQTMRNKSGSNKTITPASGQCIVGKTGATAANVTIANNKSVFVEGDGTNLFVDGDVA